MLIQLAFEMRLWTAPVLITRQHTLDTSPGRKICRVFEIGKLHLRVAGRVAQVDDNVVRVDIFVDQRVSARMVRLIMWTQPRCTTS